MLWKYGNIKVIREVRYEVREYIIIEIDEVIDKINLLSMEE